MKTHTSGFKEQIKLIGKEIESKITFGDMVLGKNDLNAITPSYQGALLKSTMKQLDIDSNVEIPVGTILKYEFGLKVNGEYEYINFGNYVVYSVEKQEDTMSYKITCYDKLLYSMVDYENMNIQYPISIRDYINKVCEHLGLVFANVNDEFANYDKLIPSELYLDEDKNSLGYTFRDVFDELAQVTASVICLNENDELEIRYINNTEDTIDEEYLKNVNVNFGEKFGAINTIVLSRSADSDSVYYPSEIPENPIEFKISDNQIMNFNDRSDYLPDIYEKLNGLEFYINDFSSTGVIYYDLYDMYNVKIGDNIYPCIMLNDEVLITQGLEEIIYTDKPEETNTDYNKADKTDRKINQVSLIVDKQNQTIQSIASKVADVSKIITGIGNINLENAHEGPLHKLTIKGNVSLNYPNNNLFPSSNLYPKIFKLQVDETIYELDINYLNYINEKICDEFICEDGQCYIVRRIEIDENGQMQQLSNEIIEERKDVFINISQSSTIKLLGFEYAILKIEYLLQNQYTDVFANQAYVNSEIKQTADEINIEVSKKVNEDEVVSAINLSPEKITLDSNRLEINSTYFKLYEDGRIESTSGKIGGYNLEADNFNTEIKTELGFSLNTQEEFNTITTKINNYISGSGSLSDEELKLYDINDDGIVDRNDLLRIQRIFYGYEKLNGTFKIDSRDGTKTLTFTSDDGETTGYLGLNGFKTNNLTANYGTITENLDVENLTVNGNFTNNSDLRLKHDINQLDDNYVNIVKELNPVSFIYNQNDTKHIGFIAQDMEEVFKNNNLEAIPVKIDEIGMYSINYINLIGILWKDNQYLHKEIEKLKEMNN